MNNHERPQRGYAKIRFADEIAADNQAPPADDNEERAQAVLDKQAELERRLSALEARVNVRPHGGMASKINMQRSLVEFGRPR